MKKTKSYFLTKTMRFEIIARLFFFSVVLLTLSCFVLADEIQSLRTMPIQNGGRIKPFDTFSRQVFLMVFGSDKTFAQDPNALILSWLNEPEEWQQTKFIEILDSKLKSTVGLDEQEALFSPGELVANVALDDLIEDMKERRQRGEALSTEDRILLKLDRQLTSFLYVASGDLLKIIPTETGEWVSLAEASDEVKEGYQKILDEIFIRVSGNEGQKIPFHLGKVRIEKGLSAIQDFRKHYQSSALLPRYQNDRLDTEVFYNDFKPLIWTLCGYGMALFIFILGKFSFIEQMLLKIRIPQKRFVSLGILLMIIGFLFHAFTLTTRIYLNGFAFGNFQEGFIWLAWIIVLFGFIACKTKHFVWLTSMLLFAIVILAFCFQAPAIYDQQSILADIVIE